MLIEVLQLEDIATMFSNSEDLLTIHRALLQKLKQMDKRWVVKGLGQVITLHSACQCVPHAFMFLALGAS